MKKGMVVAVVLILGVVGSYLAAPLFIDREVNEPFDFPADLDVAEMSAGQRQEAMARAFAMAKAKPDTVMDEAMPEQPIAVASGSFVDVDRLHKGSGTATLYRLPDGEHIVRLDPFSVSNGPDLYVYLAKNTNPGNGDAVKQGFVSLGKLKGNKGSQNYPIPRGVNPAQYGSVVVFCQLFGVLFSPAPLEFSGS